MKPSFFRLIARSVIAAWLLGFMIVFSYARSQEWTEARARDDGVFLLHELIEQTPVPARAEKLRELQTHTRIPLALLTIETAETRVGRPIPRGEATRLQEEPHRQWVFLPLSDEATVLAAGPVDPSLPVDTIPVGAIVALLGLPLIAAFVAFRLQREVAKVERASLALAEGELSARVDNPHGPSRELAAQFNAMAERIERLVRSRDELVQAVSHELGSPLSRLRFHVALLDRPGEAKTERLRAMNRELDALDELVSELLNYVQSEHLDLDCEDFSPEPGLTDLVELAVLEADDPEAIRIDMDLAAVSVYADRRLFLRAIENLTRNAVRHARHEVHVRVTENDDGVHVSIHDDGPGIPASLRERVARPFFRLSAERDRKTGGVGLGLAIVHRIVHRHGGRLEIGDAPLGGAVVTTTWPPRPPA
ncbi:MAG: ATP-binding protein [Myxococcota bacterium]